MPSFNLDAWFIQLGTEYLLSVLDAMIDPKVRLKQESSHSDDTLDLFNITREDES